MTIRIPRLMVFLVGMAVLGVAVFALTTVSAQSGGDRDNSVWVRVDGGPKQTGLRDGDVIGQVNGVAGGCERLNITVGVGADTKSARVGVDPDTCDVIVREIVPNPKYDKLMDMIAREEETRGAEGDTANRESGWQWFVEGHANFVGAADYETLTKTSSTFRFKTSSISHSGSLFDGSDRTFTCYGNHSGFPWYYYNEFCADLGKDLTSTSYMWAKT